MHAILISGAAGAGKDLVGGTMVNYLTATGHRAIITHYADLLKFMLKEYAGWNCKKDEEGRTLLQHYGVDVIRKKYPDFFVQFILYMTEFFGVDWEYLIIPDVRWPNEISILKESGIKTTYIRICRWGHYESPLTEEQQNNESEHALDGYPADYVLINDASKERLYKKAELLMQYIVYLDEEKEDNEDEED